MVNQALIASSAIWPAVTLMLERAIDIPAYIKPIRAAALTLPTKSVEKLEARRKLSRTTSQAWH